MALSGFICHDDYLAKTAKLTDEEVGRLFRALMAYHATGEEQEITGREWLAFDFIREDIDRAEKVHDEKCRKNREIRMNALDNERQRTITNVDERQGTLPYKDNDKEKDKDNIVKENTLTGVKEKRPQFVRPTKEEIFDFCLDNNLSIDVDRFYDYYTSNGWKVGKNAMKDWKATVRNWARDKKEPAKVVSAQQYTQRDYSGEQNDALRRMLELGTG